MMAALIIFLAIVGVGAVLYVHHRLTNRGADDTVLSPDNAEMRSPEPQSEDGCCGMHITCEKDSLLAAVSTEIVYYDDEELDAYAGRSADAYTDEEIEAFRDVLLTLLPVDIAGWARSLQLRGIELPSPVKDELLLIVSEARANRGVDESGANLKSKNA